MKCIVADDEYLVRFSVIDMIRSIADRRGTHIDEILEAKDGSQLLEIMNEQRPDVVFLDIRMPGIDGLDAMAEGRRISPDTIWIILTGHAEFGYAQRALTLGAADYLVKPASEDDIGRVIDDVVGMRSRMMKNRRMELERCLLGLMHDTIGDEYASFLEGVWDYTCTVVIMDQPFGSDDQGKSWHLLNDSIEEAVSSYGSSQLVHGLISLQDGSLLICYASEDRYETMSEVQGSVCRYLQEQFDDEEHRCTQVMKDRMMNRLADVLDFSGRVTHLAESRAGYGFGAILDEQVLEIWETSSEETRDCSHALALLWTRPDETAAWFHAYPDAVVSCLGEGSFRSYLSFLSGSEVPEPAGERGPEELLRWIDERILNGIGTEEGDHRPRLVATALEIMGKRFTEEIGLAQVADLLHVTPNHLSAQFSKVTGDTFTHTITRLRMEHAGELLRSHELNIRQVSERCGFGSSRHFSKVFKKWYGESPTQYQERVGHHRK